MKNSLSKEERINSKKTIQELFSKGSSFYLYPFLVKSISGETTDKHSILISVSKRNFKRATDRNLIKRRVKEAYRLNKHKLDSLSEKSKVLNIALVYSAKDKSSFEIIEKKLILVLERLVKEHA